MVESTNLLKLRDCIINLNTLQRSSIKNVFDNIDNSMENMLKIYIDYCISKGFTINYLANSYNLIVKDTFKEQLFFSKNHRYRYSRYLDVEEKVYNNPEYMNMYMHGLALTTVLWENHVKMFRFFMDNLPQTQPGENYLEIGPGHGFYIMQAMKYSKFKYYKAIDISAASVLMTKEILKFFKMQQKYEICCADFLELSISERYDAIIMGEVLEHVENPYMFLNKISALAHKKTYIYVSTCINAPEVDHIYLFKNLEEIEFLFLKAGLTIKKQLILPYKNTNINESLKEKLPVNVAYVLEKHE